MLKDRTFNMKVFLAVWLIGIMWLAEAEEFLPSSTWAVLIAGSTGWVNYRHQADICHAYHTLVNKGVHPDRIILMMYDDIANHAENPDKGKILNHPDGPDLYKGVKIDYRGDDVTVANFKNVLLGNKEALKGKGTGRVLGSGPNDHVFINFVDHGATGQLIFPSESLYAHEFIGILKEMKNKGKYGKMVIYIEACESGSMFDNLIGHYDDIFVTTAAAPDESSFAWYCDTGVCLGDLYNIAWTERLDQLNSTETLFEQFDAVRTRVLVKSHVNVYGDYRLGFMEFGRFDSINNKLNTARVENNDYQDSGVNSRDVPLYFAMKEVEKASADLPEKKKKLDTIIKGRDFADELVSNILDRFTNGNYTLKMDLEDNRYTMNYDMFDCYKSIVSFFETSCYKVTKHTYFLKHLYKFANICVKGYDENEFKRSVEITCNQQNGKFELIE